MSEAADVVIVGAGVNGASIAFQLAVRGIRGVIVLDSRFPGAGASSRGMGILRTYHANAPEAALAIRSLDVFKQWPDVVGGGCGYTATGFLWIDGPAAAPDIHKNAEMVRRLGGNTTALSAEELQELQPHFSVEGVGAAAYEPDCGYAYGALATDSFLAAATARGVKLLTRMPVLRVLAERGIVQGVETAHGPIYSRVVVLAAGAWTAPLAATVGIDLPVVPRRLTTGRAYLPIPLEGACTFIDAAIDTSFKPDGANTALVSMRDRHYGDPVDPDLLTDEVGPEALTGGLMKIQRRIPSMRSAVGGRTWTGVDGFTPDYKGIYGAAPACEGLFVCAGASEKGFKVSPAVGIGMAELIATGKADTVDLSAFSLERFAGGYTRREALDVNQLL